MSRGYCASASTFCPGSGRCRASRRTAPSPPCTASDSSASSLSCPASSATCPQGSPPIRRMATSRLECWPCWRFSPHDRVRSSGHSLSPSTSSAPAISLLAYYHAIQVGLPSIAGELGSAYAIPILYVPILMITHFFAIYWLARPLPSKIA